MAGKLIIDTIQTDSSFLQLNVGTTRIATMNNSGIYSNTGTKMIGYDGTIGVATFSGSALTANTVTGDKLGQSAVSSNNIASGVTIASPTLTTPTVSGNTNFDSGTLFVNASNNRVGVGTTDPMEALDVRANATFGTAGDVDASIHIQSGYDVGIKYLTRLKTDYNGVFSIHSGSTSSANTPSQATLTERMRINNVGQIGWGTTPSSIDGWLTLTWRGQSYVGMVMNNLDAFGASANFRFKNNGTSVGEITSTTSATTYTTSSDYRLKENVAPMTGALDKVALLKPVTYTWKNSGEEGQGFIAHELQEVIPDAVVGEKDGMETYEEDGVEKTRIKPQGIDTSFLVATLTAAIQELKAENDALKARLDAAGL